MHLSDDDGLDTGVVFRLLHFGVDTGDDDDDVVVVVVVDNGMNVDEGTFFFCGVCNISDIFSTASSVIISSNQSIIKNGFGKSFFT